jgi:hypothetical protein
LVERLSTPFSVYGNNGRPLVDLSLLSRIKKFGVKLNEIDISALRLTPGVELQLNRAHIWTIEQLCECSDTDLVDLYEIGHKRVKQIEKRLNALLIGMLERADQLQQKESEIAVKYAHFIRVATQLRDFVERLGLLNEIRLPNHVRNTLSWAFDEKPVTIADILQLTRTVVIIPQHVDGEFIFHPNTDDLAAAIESIEKLLNHKSVDDEMIDLFRCVTDRERFVLVNRFGMRKRLTLDEIGAKENICRERVRQIEDNAQKKLARCSSRESLLLCSRAAVVVLERLSEDATFDLWKQRLSNIGLLKEESSLELLVVVCRTSGNPLLTLPARVSNTLQTHLAPRIHANKKRIIEKARKLCRNCGAVRTEMLKDDSLSETDVEQILSLGRFTKLQPGWWMKETARHVPKRIATQVITNCGPVSSDNIAEALRRHLLRSEWPSPPSDVLAKVLIQTGDFALIDGLLKLVGEGMKRFPLTRPEEVFLQLVNDEGPVVPFELIYNRLLKNGFSLATVTGLLRYSPIVHKVAAGLYTRLGAQYDAESIDVARSRVTRIPNRYSIKAHSNGKVDFETNVGTWGLYGGVLSCGPAAAMEGAWKLISRGIEGGQLIVGGGFIRGLSDIVEDLELIATDRVRIEFNTWTREAEIRKC